MASSKRIKMTVRLSWLLKKLQTATQYSFLCHVVADYATKKEAKNSSNVRFDADRAQTYKELHRLLPQHIQAPKSYLGTLSDWLVSPPEHLAKLHQAHQFHQFRLEFLKWLLTIVGDKKITFHLNAV